MVNSKKNNTVRVPVNRISSSKSDQAVEKPTVGFIGLGIMGSAMSKNLHQAGFHVYGFDPSPKQQKLMKKEGIDVEMYCPSIMAIEEMKKWTDFIKEHNLDWINVADPYRQNNFRFEWDIQSTPQIYILDKDKIIRAKRICAEPVEDFIKHEIDPKYKPMKPTIMDDENSPEPVDGKK